MGAAIICTELGRKLKGTGYIDLLVSDTKDIERPFEKVHFYLTPARRDENSICDMLAEPAIL